jgi:hypothetical protein
VRENTEEKLIRACAHIERKRDRKRSRFSTTTMILLVTITVTEEGVIVLLIFFARNTSSVSPKGTDSYGQEVLAFELTRVLGHNG